MSAEGHSRKSGPNLVLTKEEFLGTERRWRRFGEPVAAGDSLKEDGTPDYGMFGPGSIVWDVLLHPSTVFNESVAQGIAQLLYRPIAAGIRDKDPISRKAHEGTLTFFDSFERFQRNAGMHAPMWFGDTPTAQNLAKHVANIHRRVEGGIIDVGAPELGGFEANGTREAMWAALTELHPILRAYEAFAFRDGKFPHKLTQAERDRYWAESAPYVELVGGDPAEVPRSRADLAALYEKYEVFFQYSKTMDIIPETGESHLKSLSATMQKNFHRSQIRAAAQIMLQFVFFKPVIMGALPKAARRSAGMGKVSSAFAVIAAKAGLPLMWIMQQPKVEAYYLRLMWGPDAVKLIHSARSLHAQARAGKLAT